MKRNYIIISAGTIFFIYLFNAFTKSAGPPPYYTGAPYEQTCTAATCHDGKTGTDNMGSGTCDIIFNNGDSTYSDGAVYPIRVSVSHPNFKKFGFQIVALIKSSKYPAGNVILTDTINTQLRDKKNVTWGCCQNREWVEHTTQGNTSPTSGKIEWTYNWQAPNTNAGNITFYLAALAADNDATDTLDFTYTKTKTISYKKYNGISAIFSDEKIFHFTNGNGEIFFTNLPENSEISIFNLNGSRIYSGRYFQNIPVTVQQSGVYFITYSKDDFYQCEKAVIFHSF